MNELREWTTVLCTVGVACMVLRYLCPAGNMRRVFETLCGVVLFCCLLTPISAVGDMLRTVVVPPMASDVSSAVTEQAEEQLLRLTASTLRADAERLLADRAVTVKDVRAIRDSQRTDGIYIECVEVVFSKEDYPVSRDIPLLLERTWGMTVEVYYVK